MITQMYDEVLYPNAALQVEILMQIRMPEITESLIVLTEREYIAF